MCSENNSFRWYKGRSLLNIRSFESGGKQCGEPAPRPHLKLLILIYDREYCTAYYFSAVWEPTTFHVVVNHEHLSIIAVTLKLVQP